MTHALIALAFCVSCLLLCLPWPVFFWPALLYAGRERAQAEERWMRARNLNRAPYPPWAGFAPSAWTAKSLLDFALPLAVSIAFTILSLIL